MDVKIMIDKYSNKYGVTSITMPFEQYDAMLDRINELEVATCFCQLNKNKIERNDIVMIRSGFYKNSYARVVSARVEMLGCYTVEVKGKHLEIKDVDQITLVAKGLK
jgi:hypothetical protein